MTHDSARGGRCLLRIDLDDMEAAGDRQRTGNRALYKRYSLCWHRPCRANSRHIALFSIGHIFMRFDVITLFPELITPYLQHGVTRRAFISGAVQVRLWQLRDFSEGNYRRVDDRPFGGGPGMVMQAEPLWRCLQAVLADRALSHPYIQPTVADAATGSCADSPGAAPDDSAAHSLVADTPCLETACNATSQREPKAALLSPVPVVLFSPAGQTLCHTNVEQWAQGQGAILICGRYEGIDQRLIDAAVTHQISLGDFVLSGGEIAAVAMLDAIARLQPGVLHTEASYVQDSFNPALGGLLDCPHYTRPEVWRGHSVPDVLLGGNHAAIAQWRQSQSLAITRQQRPDLLADSMTNSVPGLRDGLR